jgi:hypothetical protein
VSVWVVHDGLCGTYISVWLAHVGLCAVCESVWLSMVLSELVRIISRGQGMENSSVREMDSLLSRATPDPTIACFDHQRYTAPGEAQA